jgi:hypothetical protein
VFDAQLTVEMTPPQQQGGIPALIAEDASLVPDDYDSETSCKRAMGKTGLSNSLPNV